MNATQNQAPRVLDVGNCGHDHGQISSMLQRNFGAVTEVADTADQALERLVREPFDLVLVNRKLDHDYSDGIEIVKRIKQDPQLAHVPVMLITNYAEHQETAVAQGALLGFGKQELASPRTRERLAAVLAGVGNAVGKPDGQRSEHERASSSGSRGATHADLSARNV